MSFIVKRQKPNFDHGVLDVDHWHNWHRRVVIIWEEDDATRGQDYERDGHEKAVHAFKRIFRLDLTHADVIDRHDDGEWQATLHSNGRVTGSTCEGGFVGVVAESGIKVSRGGGVISGTLPCGHDSRHLDVATKPLPRQPYCAACWNE